MTCCTDREPALNALFDGELDSLNAAEIEAHVRSCAACAAYLESLSAIRAALAPAAQGEHAPAGLHRAIEDMIARFEPVPPPAKPQAAARRFLPWLGGGAIGALAASLALLLTPLQSGGSDLSDQLVASHVRSLQVAHLIDVQTSDRHVVKPWFNGRIDFSPPVVDLAAQGFPLVGGRLDYIADRPVAALVYRRRLHTINLFIGPAQTSPATYPDAVRHRSYTIVHWKMGDLEYWAVSDIAAGDLQQFQQQFVKAAAS